MRLKTIKLAGFKSFVDPTSVDFPSNMCAVVGPNGCGKSNIIDAVRWVMGESSAKNLRGEAMTDVIFNGSGSRKPVGQASIELIFDNSDATVTGEYAGYSEISVKRRVTRDGQNLYYLNNNRCRRRDITDIFLGTGLGPRSYAIIEQGMISRLIEAKPEELRVYIEEAAGISKYKERRKDTENRMRRTHENLERLTDIREELERQLSRLERQAKAAEKYAEFKAEEREVNAKLQATQYQTLQASADKLKQVVSESELAVEASVTKRVKLDAEIEKHRSDFTEKSDVFNMAQGKYYALGTDIARIEQNIKHNQEREQALRIDLESTERDRRDAEQHQSIDRAKIEGWEAELLEIAPESEMLKSELEKAREVLSLSDSAMQEWQGKWEEFNQRASEPKQAAEVQQSRIQYLDQVQQRLLQRKEKILGEVENIDVDDDQASMQTASEELADLELAIEALSENMSDGTRQVGEYREKLGTLNQQRAQLQTSLQTSKGRLASLEALQAAALGSDGAVLNEWALEQNLDSENRLANCITVTDGWEKAVETVLGSSLQALCTSNPIDQYFEQLNKLDAAGELLSSSISVDGSLTSEDNLSAYVSSDFSLQHLLGNVKTAESLADAKTKLNTLKLGESLITRDGIWLSKNWVRIAVENDAKAGVIKRKAEIETLQTDIETIEGDLHAIIAQIEETNSALDSAEQARETARQSYEEKRKDVNNARSDIAAKRSQIEQLVNKQQQAERESKEIDEQLALESENLAEARAILEEAIVAIDADSNERESLLSQRDALREKLDEARQQARLAQDKSHDLDMRQSSTKTQLESMRQGLQRLEDQIARLKERHEQLQAALETASAPSDEQQLELEALLERRIDAESKLSDARRGMDDTESGLREAEKARDNAEKTVNEQRATLENTRLELQRVDVQGQTIREQVAAQELVLDEVIATLTEEDTAEQCQARLTELAAKVARLGAINLAAIEEYKTESERKRYLDEQNDDLCEALETLSAAIHKIDVETRTRFKETYDKVNSGLQNLFPRLFGGGHAYLELTGEDLLDTGIAIMARPPGKKNSTIHLLSGGEKALTAIALVFSIFQLNPAPFCMLDEVDAPLDDANVGRYANIVHSLSDQVQFIYITHNKIAMEKAQHLMGVTMQEAGVSRMVTVDVEEAAELAAV